MRSVLRFSVRRFGTAAELEGIVPQLEASFGGQFIRGEFNKVPALVTQTLGMLVGVFPWVGRGGADVMRMDSYPSATRLVVDPNDPHADPEWIDISSAIIDLLEVNGAGSWFTPNDDDVAADIELGAAYDRSLRAGPSEFEGED